MWSKYEIDSIYKLYSQLEPAGLPELLEFLSQEEREAIASCGKLTVANLRDYLLVPKHNRTPKTIRLTRLNYKFDLNDWLQEIEPLIAGPCDIRIGYSFIAKAKDELIFVFCPKALAPYKAQVKNKTELKEFFSQVKSMKEPDHLENTFFSTLSGSAFTESGYTPFKLVSNTIWISK